MALRFGMSLLPIMLLTLAAMRARDEGRPDTVLWLATGVQVILSALVLRSRRLGRMRWRRSLLTRWRLRTGGRRWWWRARILLR